MMYTIGIDPHKRSHTAVAVDEAENEIARRRVIAGPDQLAELNGFAAGLEGECRWAIEAASGVGLLLAQQFARSGIDVVDVPPTLAARVRLLGSGRTAKTDPAHGPRSRPDCTPFSVKFCLVGPAPGCGRIWHENCLTNSIWIIRLMSPDVNWRSS